MTDNAIRNPETSGLEVTVDDDALRRRNRTALVLLLAATFTVFLNETTMSVAIPTIIDDLHITAAAGQWLTTAFALTLAVVIPVTGWLLQRLTTRQVFIAALVLFSIGTLIAATAPVFGVLVVGRVVQASGTALMMPLMMTTMLTIVPMSQRGRIMGRVSIVMSVAPAVGPAISGVLLEAFHHQWRGLFWVMLPIALIMLVIGVLRVPNVSELKRVPLDVPSVILSAIGFAGFVYGLSSLGEAAESGTMVPPWVPLAIGIVFLALFALRQVQLQRRDAAFLDLRTFASRPFTISVIMLAIGMMALFGMVILLPIYLQNALGLATTTIGLILLPGPLLSGILGPLVGRLFDRVGPLPLVVPGSIVISASFWLFAFGLGVDTQIWVIILANVLLGLGLAFLFTPLFSSGLGSLPPHLYSHGSALVSTLQQVAGAAGTAIFVALLSIGMAAAGETDVTVASPSQIVAGVHQAFIVGAFITVALVVASFFVRKPAAAPEGAGFAGH
ncbi:DHA2 family efflux MFS transporter permease subunit [Schumannella sp. 10F1B-5-1]|uniref:DHA2 family efflux MFS transporter permease subunit n=1 Tax=Schumannella sp. 10F1B-5-1 TaxID=2590780 RepID=UPI001131D7E3|nr:DHA2 family efflux MFS transporter permease subunit [Schumannella sp. 10F1B-5-1]TPW70883.1 multidrug efflux MFS transporter [Schumannella sp. 10F1B-5-1]